MSKVIQVVLGGAVTDAILVGDDAVISANGGSVRFGDTELEIGGGGPAAGSFMDVEGAQIGWLVEGGTLVPPPEPEPPAIDLVAYAADARWRKEVGGITVAGVPIATDDRSKMMIVGARVAAAADPGWSTVWHGADGNTYPVDAAAMIAISDMVQAHVNSTFGTFAAVKAAIEAGEITTTAEIDAEFAA